MLITTRNTFITVEEAFAGELLPGSSRRRGKSCPPTFETSDVDGDSLSTAPTQSSPIMRPTTRCSPNIPSVVISNVPSGLTCADMSKLLAERGFCISPMNISSKPTPIDRSGACSVTITPPTSNFAMGLFQTFHGDMIEGRVISVDLVVQPHYGKCGGMKRAKGAESKRTGGLSKKKVFVGGLRPQTDSGSLRRYFEQFGQIKDCGVVSDFNGTSRRFGFCEFIAEESLRDVLLVGKHYIDTQLIAIRPYCLRD